MESILKMLDVMTWFWNPIIIFILTVIIFNISSFQNYQRVTDPILGRVFTALLDDWKHMFFIDGHI